MNYKYLSKIYDFSMEKSILEKWYKIIDTVLSTNINNVLELGCGSGNVTAYLLEKGYEVVGIDNSIEMLTLAHEKTLKYKDKVIILNQDINNIDLDIYDIDMIIATNDILNYIYEEKSLTNIFQFSFNHLKKGGILFFDYSSAYKFKNILDGNVFTEDFGDYYYVWKNFYDDSNSILEIDVDIFEQNKNNTYTRYSEIQIQKAHNPNYIKKLLKNAGFNKIKIFSDFDINKNDLTQANRIFFLIEKG